MRTSIITIEKAWVDTATGYHCRIHKVVFTKEALEAFKENGTPVNTKFHYCGYVTFKLPKGLKVSDDDCLRFKDILVHGNVSFVKNVGISRLTVGFDCHHPGDHDSEGNSVWDIPGVTKQTEFLAAELKTLMDAYGTGGKNVQ